MNSFEERDSLCDLSPDKIAEYLDYLGDVDGAASLRKAGVRGQAFAYLPGGAWRASGHQIGFIEDSSDLEIQSVIPINQIQAEQGLVGTPLKITLQTFRIAQYPGFGKHTIILEVTCRNQAGQEKEDLRFTTTLEVSDGDRAGINGLPIFTGLIAPDDGLAFDARTIKVSSSGSDAIIAALKSDAFRQGMKLIGQVQPVIPQFVQLAAGVTNSLLDTGSQQIQKFSLGLDFNGPNTSARLRKGSYVVVQAPDDGSWRWDNWKYSSQTMGLLDTQGVVAPYNYMIIGISSSSASAPMAASRPQKPLEAGSTKAKGK